MAHTPEPISTALPASRIQLIVAKHTRQSANAESAIAIASDRAVIHGSYPIGTGRLNASIPTKCIDQMPMPMATDPPASHHHLEDCPCAPAIRPAISRAVNEASIAISTEANTSHGL